MSARSVLSYRTLFLVGVASAAMIVSVSCGDNGNGNGDPEDEATTGVGLDCTPGEELECECTDGSMGTQMCLSSGNEAGPCDCGGYGGFLPGDYESRSVTKTFELSGQRPAPSVGVEFTWYATAGRPAPSDLDIQVPGQADPVIQVFSSADAVPYLRSGLVVKQLQADVTYSATISLDKVEVTGPNGALVLEQSLDLASLNQITYTAPEPSIYAAPVVIDALQER